MPFPESTWKQVSKAPVSPSETFVKPSRTADYLYCPTFTTYRELFLQPFNNPRGEGKEVRGSSLTPFPSPSRTLSLSIYLRLCGPLNPKRCSSIPPKLPHCTPKPPFHLLKPHKPLLWLSLNNIETPAPFALTWSFSETLFWNSIWDIICKLIFFIHTKNVRS